MSFLDILALIAALRVWMLGWQVLFLIGLKTPCTERSQAGSGPGWMRSMYLLARNQHNLCAFLFDSSVIDRHIFTLFVIDHFHGKRECLRVLQERSPSILKNGGAFLPSGVATSLTMTWGGSLVLQVLLTSVRQGTFWCFKIAFIVKIFPLENI